MEPDDLRFIRPCSPALERSLLDAARNQYSGFYRSADAGDAKIMDDLVLCRTTLKNAFNEPRDYMPPEFSVSFEQVCNHTEQVFTRLREGVRTSETFRRLNGMDRLHIEFTLFSIQCVVRGE